MTGPNFKKLKLFLIRIGALAPILSLAKKISAVGFRYVCLIVSVSMTYMGQPNCF